MDSRSPFPGGRPVRLGIAGCGNMGGAFARGIVREAALAASFSLSVYDPGDRATASMRELGVRLASSASELARDADMILVAVKPQYVAGLLADISPALREAKDREGPFPGRVLVSIAAGATVDFLRDGVAGACPVARVMPNTLVEVGQGLFGLCLDPASPLPQTAEAALRFLLAGLGRIVDLDEDRMNAFTALAGSGPAYVFHFMDSLAEAGVSVGLTRESSKMIALGLLRGCAALAEVTGEHAAVLREQVSSPAGTTIAALNHLDRTGTRGHLIDAVLAALARGNAMEKER